MFKKSKVTNYYIGNEVGILSTDMSKAFDSLHPPLLLNKLCAYGFKILNISNILVVVVIKLWLRSLSYGGSYKRQSTVPIYVKRKTTDPPTECL